MNTHHPTEELFFVFALTFCRLKVYSSDVEFARKLLSAAEVEFFEHTDEDCLEIDTRLLIHLLQTAIPEMLRIAIPKSDDVIATALRTFAVRKGI